MAVRRVSVFRIGRRSAVWSFGLSALLHLGVGAALYPFALREPGPAGALVPDAAQFDPRSAAAAAVPLRIVAAIPEMNGDFVRAQLDAQVARQRDALPRDQLERLETMGRQLERLSSGDSLEELSERFHAWMGSAQRAAQPAVAADAGKFDPATAQIHDVSRRRQPPDGAWRYSCVLLDAQGRTIEVELDAELGETVYELMRRIKAHPLLEKVYRLIFMPLADQLRDRAETTAARPLSSTN